MYHMEKEKLSRKHHKNNPSFSSTLLDEIYRSIDGYDQIRKEDFKFLPKDTTKKYNNNDGGVKPKFYNNNKNNNNNKSSIEDEELASFRRACLIEKWMEKKVKDKALMTRKPTTEILDNNDALFFSSSTSSSESNSGTLSVSSSSETDSFYTEKTSRTTTTCFAAPRTKSMRRASVSPRRDHQQREFYVVDDYHHHNSKTVENTESLIKSKSRAVKIYNNLKKVKQPISPGGRLTNFLTSIFTNSNNNNNNGNVKKSKNLKEENRGGGGASSTCSSASSFSRSCLSKTPPKFRDNNGVKRTVTFNPVGVIVDEDCRPCGHKCIYDQVSGYDLQKQPKFQGRNTNAAAIMEKNRKFAEVTKADSLKSYQQIKKKNDYIVDYPEEEDFEDAASDSSSDLFEIDHLAFFGNNRFCEELPVYETTNLNRIASGLIR